MRRRGRADLRDGVAHDRVEVDPLAVERHPARLHLVEVKHLVDHPVEALRVLVDVARVLAHLVEREVLAPHHLREPLDPRKRGAELVADDGDEVALRSIQPLELGDGLALLLERFGGRDRDAQLLRDGFDEPDIICGPLTRAVDVGQRERAGELATHANGCGRDGDGAAQRDTCAQAPVEPLVPTEIRRDDGAAEPRGQYCDGKAPSDLADRRHPGCVPFIGHAERRLGLADEHDAAGNGEGLRDLIDRATQDLLRIRARAGTLGDAAHDRFALGARLRLGDRERGVDRARDVLAHHHRDLKLVRDELLGTLSEEEHRADQALARNERQRRERANPGERGQRFREAGPAVEIRGRVAQHERLPVVDDAGAEDPRKRARGVRLPAERLGPRAVGGDRAEPLDDVVVDDETDGRVRGEGTADGGNEMLPDLFEVERSGERRGETEDRAELVVLLLLSGLRARERAREPMHDHSGDQADAEPDDE